MADDDYEDLDDLTRAELAERDGPGHAVATVLDEWLHRLHGVTSSGHGAGLFLDLLAAKGWGVEKINAPKLWELLPPLNGRDAPVRVTYMTGATAEEIERAKAEVIERVRELQAETGGGSDD